jgi:hypothetical protein
MPEEVRNLSPRLVFESYPLPFPKMFTLYRLTASSLVAATLLGMVGSASAIDLEGLVKNSPFGAAAAGGLANAAPGTLEFRGMYVDRGVSYYSIYNLQTKQSSWVAEGEAASVNVPVVIKGFDAANEALLVDNAGQPQRMELHQAIVVKYAGPAAVPMTTVTNGIAATPPAAPGAFNVNNLTPEQIEAFRQSMRDRFSQGGQGGGNGRNRGGDANGEVPATSTTRTKKAPK